MDISGSRIIALDRASVWRGLLDLRVLRAAVPGCEDLADLGDGTLKGAIVAAVGPVRARFKGTIRQKKLVANERYEVDFEGEGGMAGFANGSAVVELADAPGGTELRWRATTHIGGRLAQIGARLIEATVNRLSGQFFSKFESVVANPALLDVPETVLPGMLADMPVARPAASAGRSDLVVLQMPAWIFAIGLVAGAATIVLLAMH